MNNTSKGKNMAERVLSAIEAQEVTPKPAWHFLLREWVVWGVSFAALCVGAVATALTLYIAQSSYITLRHLQHSDAYVLLEIVPVVWLVLGAVGIFYTVHALRGTQKGYRWATRWVVSGALLVSVVCGWVFYLGGVGQIIDNYLISEMPMYQMLSGFQPEHVMNTRMGILAGTVINVDDDMFTLRMLNGETVAVHIASTTQIHHGILHDGARVHVVGTTTGAYFTADMVGVFRGRKAMIRERNMH